MRLGWGRLRTAGDGWAFGGLDLDWLACGDIGLGWFGFEVQELGIGIWRLAICGKVDLRVGIWEGLAELDLFGGFGFEGVNNILEKWKMGGKEFVAGLLMCCWQEVGLELEVQVNINLYSNRKTKSDPNTV